MARQKATSKAASGDASQILSYRHPNKRVNNPDVGLVNPETDPAQPKTTWAYDPHLDPALQFDVRRAQIEKLIDDALASGDQDTMRDALAELKRLQSPYLNWSGKAERTSFDIDTVSLHVHERIDPASILSAVRKQMNSKNPSPASGESEARGAKPAGVRVGGEGKSGKQKLPAWQQPGLFDAPFENVPLRDAIDFYRHERGWANRMIAGDSLLVMNSLLQKESMAGQVQMIYFDPPYGIKYGSNFQPFTNKRDVKDRKDEDLTQEPEMIKAFRDTWELGIHSYLTYLRDRLLLAKDLLSESGSVFVQISDENVHLVRNLMDEVFGTENFASLIPFAKTTSSSTNTKLSVVCDYLLWYCKDVDKLKYHQLYFEKKIDGVGGGAYRKVRNLSGYSRGLNDQESEDVNSVPNGWRVFRLDNLTSSRPAGDGDVTSFDFWGKSFKPGKGTFKTDEKGLSRLNIAGRLEPAGNTLSYVRYLDDFQVFPVSGLWDDTTIAGFAADKRYVVETSTKVIERCLLMTTDPGDLVLDPTCGSGTTAFVAEKWGRRWITCDTSRVAVTLAKQRLMTASYDYYELRYPHEGLKSGFIYKTVPHVTLKSIANNPEIDGIYERMHPAIEVALAELNTALSGSSSFPRKRESSAPANKDLDARLRGHDGQMKEWEVPFDYPEDWPEVGRKPFDVFHAARQSMQKQMDASIAAHADQETLYDQPQAAKNKLRITGPFTVEAVPFPTVYALESLTPPSPQPLSQGERGYMMEADVTIARSGESSRQHQWRDELLKTGIRGKGGQMLKFAELETLPGTRYLHASGTLAESSPQPLSQGERGERVVVSFGPEHAALEQRQVALALDEAAELFPRPKVIVFCAFTFDPEAAKDIDHLKGITALKAQMNTDLLTDDLKKARSSNQSFWLMGQPDVELRRISAPSPQPSPPKVGEGVRPPSPAGGRGAGGEGVWYEVEVHGFDYFDTAKGELVSGGKNKIAVWMLDTDYDDRSLFPRQVFFPLAGKDDGWFKLKKNIRAELDEEAMKAYHGTISLPFEAGEHHKVAVKIVDDRGIESLKIISLEEKT